MPTQEEKKITLGKRKTEQFFKELVELMNYLERDFIRVSISKREGEIFLGDLGKSITLDYTGFFYSTEKEDDRAKYEKITHFQKKFQRYKSAILDTVMPEKRHIESGHHHCYVEFHMYSDDTPKAYQDFVGEDYLIEKEKDELEKTVPTPTTQPKKLKV